MLEFEKPYELLSTVKELRLHGIEIELCNEEKEKYEKLKKKKEILTHNVDIKEIIDNYEKDPTEFEKLCALLFRQMGYEANVTSKTNDGGYDIVLMKNQIKAIVECKCYSIGNKVGRPEVQKLVGANNIVLADKMIFITTSEFSSYAVTYSNEVGVELIDGCKLLQLLKDYLFLEKGKTKIDIRECYLEISDMRTYVPKDIYQNYFW